MHIDFGIKVVTVEGSMVVRRDREGGLSMPISLALTAELDTTFIFYDTEEVDINRPMSTETGTLCNHSCVAKRERAGNSFNGSTSEDSNQ